MSPPQISHVGVSAERNQVARWASTFSALLHVGFVLLGSDGEVDDATSTACELFGASAPDDLKARWTVIQEKLAPSLRENTDTPQIVDIAFELDGQSRRVQCEVHPLTEDDCVGHLLLVQSSERVAAVERALQLASRYQTLASLHLTTAHDFKGSLNAVTLNVELLGRTLEPGAARENDREVQRHCLQAIRQELGILALSVGSVLDESRLDQTQPSRCHLAPVLESVLMLLRAKAERQRVTMRLGVSDPTIEVMGVASEMRQAVLNLANNSLEAMPQGGELTIELKADGPMAVLMVSDTGPGVSGDLRHKIWDLYFSTKTQGHGIGLHVVRSVARAHGGTVTLDRTESGARFTIRLPLAR